MSIAKSTRILVFVHFFFSSRRRHTRWPRDWSSDVCSSDLSLVLAIIGVLLVPVGQLSLRESGALRRLRLTPLRPSTFVAADLTMNFAIGMIGMLAALAVGWLVFGATPSGNLILILLAAALGLVAFLALGYTLAALYPSSGAATGIGNVLMLLLMLSSGAFIPLTTMPEGVQAIMNFSPV